MDNKSSNEKETKKENESNKDFKNLYMNKQIESFFKNFMGIDVTSNIYDDEETKENSK